MIFWQDSDGTSIGRVAATGAMAVQARSSAARLGAVGEVSEAGWTQAGRT